MTKPNAIVLVPDGVGIRNFVIGRFLGELARAFRPQVFHVIPQSLVAGYAGAVDPSVVWRPLLPYRQSRLALVLQDSLGYAHMYWANTHAMRRALHRPVRGPLRSRLRVRAARALGRATAAAGCTEGMDRLHCRAVERLPEFRRYIDLLSKLRPAVLFCSHQRPTSVVPAVLAARALGIPTASFIFSWDNLSSKGRIAAPFDHFLVWSEHMKGELMKYYPSVPRDRIHVVGTPQFDPYGDPSLLWSREEFCGRAGLDPLRPVICYSGGDAGTAPEDPKHVEALMSLVRDGRIRHNPQVLLRPVPVDDGSRYEGVCRRYPELRKLQPQWVHTEPGNWSRVIPLAEDVQFLANLTHHADLNVNLGSTMTLDFGIHDRPVVNVAFDCSDPPVFGMPVYDYYYCYEHLQPVIEFGASRIARSVRELAESVNAYLDDPSLDREGRRRLVELQVDLPLGNSSRRIVEVLQTLTRANTNVPPTFCVQAQVF
jgi:hypothetical protein